MSYVPLLDVRIAHPYYRDGRCPDIRVEPSDDTRRRLRGQRCVLRTRADGVAVLVELGDGGDPVVAFDEPVPLGFHLRLANPDFALFTDLDALAALPAPVFTDDGDPRPNVPLRLTTRTRRAAETLAVARPGAREALTLAGNPLEDVGVDEFRVEGIGARGAVSAVAFEPEARRLVVDSRGAGAGERFRVDYPVRPRLPRGVLADLDVRIDAKRALAAPQPPASVVAFAPRQARWVYYLVTESSRRAADFRIVEGDATNGTPRRGAETGDANGVAFRDAERRDLGSKPDPSDPVAAQLAAMYPDRRRVRFISQRPVTCREAPWPQLALSLRGTALPGTLPHPSIRSYSTLGVADGGGADPEHSLYHVVRYLSH